MSPNSESRCPVAIARPNPCGALLVLLLSICAVLPLSTAVRVISNGLAPPEIVHTPINVKPRCLIRAPPLDLLFILDSSGSLRNKFQDEIDVIRRIVRHVTIGEQATRVALIQFSGVQHLEFDFNKFTNREDLFSALDVLRHVSGITRVGGAFEFAISVLANASHGIRGAAVPKIVYLLSDGRTHDFPKDSEMAQELRQRVPNLDIWAYGTGEYVAMSELAKITKNVSKIITNKNLDDLEPLFAPWHGVEVCEQRPVCVRGSDKPLDLALLIDSSESIEQIFQDQIHFVTDRVLPNIHVHPDAVRLALVTFSGQAFLHFSFNDPKMGNNSAVTRYVNTLRPIKGTTSAHLAIALALQLFSEQDQNHFAKRSNAARLALVITDGRMAEPVADISAKLREIGVELIAVSLNLLENTDERELLGLAGGNGGHVFTRRNLQDFERTFLRFVGFGCEGMELGQNSTPRIRGATDISCGPDSLTLTVRTQHAMHGLMYAQRFHSDQRCVLHASGDSRELSITFEAGHCGLQKTPIRAPEGYVFNITVILQFHPLIVTRADQGLDVSCVHEQPISARELELTAQRRFIDTQCSYRLHRFGPEHCTALDAKVGESLFHKWECDTAQGYRFLVHDCFAASAGNNVQILDSNGCEIDAHFIETPDYANMMAANEVGNGGLGGVYYVSQEMAAFKFPDDDNVIFRCQVSLCDMTGTEPCTQQIPPKCRQSPRSAVPQSDGPVPFANASSAAFEGPKKRRRKREATTATKSGFAMTLGVETRTLNVIENEGIRPPSPVRYCDVRN